MDDFRQEAGRMGAKEDFGHYRTILARDRPDLAADSFAYLGEGEDHIAFEVDGGLVFRFAKGDDGAALAREARLLRHVSDISPLPTPIPAYVNEEHGYIGYRTLPGTPLIQVLNQFEVGAWPGFAEAIGGFLRAINADPATTIAADLDVETSDLAEWLEEAQATFARVRGRIPGRFAGPIAAFLVESPPDGSCAPVFAHNDLGAEHILVDLAARWITGIIDWGDAALADPAYDLGKLYRDLGDDALDAILRHYGPTADSVALRARTTFYARCGVLEDLEYGFETVRAEYIDKSLAALSWLFP